MHSREGAALSRNRPLTSVAGGTRAAGGRCVSFRRVTFWKMRNHRSRNHHQKPVTEPKWVYYLMASQIQVVNISSVQGEAN